MRKFESVLKPGRDDSELGSRIARIAALRADWRPVADPEEGIRRRVHAAWCNAAIEGNALSWERAWRLARGDFEAVGRQDLELLGCLAGAEFLESSAPDWSLPMLRQLHALCMRGLGRAPGELRRGEVKIVKESGRGAGRVVFHPPHPIRVRELIEGLMASCGDEPEDPFLRAGRFHYEFQSIHPFEDGNGRVGRLLSTVLARRGWSAAGFHLEPALRRAGPRYYLALRAVRSDYGQEGPRGLLPWLLPFLDMAADALARPEAPRLP